MILLIQILGVNSSKVKVVINNDPSGGASEYATLQPQAFLTRKKFIPTLLIRVIIIVG